MSVLYLAFQADELPLPFGQSIIQNRVFKMSPHSLIRKTCDASKET